jgi:nucleotide-binding universal stress UspA family protein
MHIFLCIFYGYPELIMTFSSIMVDVDFEPSRDATLRIASHLSTQCDAKLIGIAAADLPWSFYAQEAPTLAVVDQLRGDIAKELASAEKRFRSITTQPARLVEWRSAQAPPSDYVAHQARAADLVVVSARRDGPLFDPFMAQIDPGDLAMRAGRPILVVPPEAEDLNLKCAVIAWKDTREARRAASEALPLLGKAQDVIVVEVIEDESQRDGAHGRLDDVVRWLSRHGIAATARVFDFPESEEPVDKLLDYGADIIVAGAYGHTRLREWAFGGFTRSFLSKSPRCVFLAH